MDRCQKIDCRTNGEAILGATRSLHRKGPKNLFTGRSTEPNGSRSPISTKNGIDSTYVFRIEKGVGIDKLSNPVPKNKILKGMFLFDN